MKVTISSIRVLREIYNDSQQTKKEKKNRKRTENV